MDLEIHGGDTVSTYPFSVSCLPPSRIVTCTSSTTLAMIEFIWDQIRMERYNGTVATIFALLLLVMAFSIFPKLH
jgi:hypothetical protein